MEWTYNGIKEFSVPEDAIGFIYYIETWGKGDMSDRKVYIGKKGLVSTRRKKIGVRAKKATKTRKTYETVVKDSGWRSYTGSSKELNQWIKDNPHTYNKRILAWAYSKKNLHYLEMKYQYQYQVLEKDSWNDNIGGRIWRKDVIKPIKDT